MESPEAWTQLTQQLAKCWTPPYSGSIREWCEDYLELPPGYSIRGPFSTGITRYMRPVFDSLQDNSVRQVNIMAGVKTAKTLLSQLYLLHLIANDEANVLWLMQTDEAADKASMLKFFKLIKHNEIVRRLLPEDNRFALSLSQITFPNVSIAIGGAKDSLLHSLDTRIVIGDELHLWRLDEGVIESAKARTKAPGYANSSKVFFISTGPSRGDSYDIEFEKGRIFEASFVCPKCGQEQLYRLRQQRHDRSWCGLDWDSYKLPDGRHDLEKCGDSARITCVHCDHVMPDTRENRRALNESTSYMLTRKGNPTIHSYRWPTWVNQFNPLRDIVMQYLQAKDLERLGNLHDLKIFTQQVLGEPWESRIGRDQTILIPNVASYEVTANWDAETHRFMAIDIQRGEGHEQGWFDKLAVVIKSVDKKSQEHRLLYAGYITGSDGKLSSLAAKAEALQLQFNVKHRNVIVDSAYETQVVYNECARHGVAGSVIQDRQLKDTWLCWNAAKGFDEQDFVHNVNGVRKELPFAPIAHKVTEQRDKSCPFIAWSNPWIKDQLKLFLNGSVGRWVIPNQDEEYVQQMNAEKKDVVRDKRTGKVLTDKAGRPILRWQKVKQDAINDFFDCELMVLVLGWTRKIFQQ